MKIFNIKRLDKENLIDSWREGFSPDLLVSSNRWTEIEADCYIQFNILNPYRSNKLNPLYNFILESKKPFLVVEEGAIRKLLDYKRIGWTSYKNNIGNFNNKNVDNTRWNKIRKETGINFIDWNSPGDNILIMGQLEYDSALIEMYNAGYKSFDDYIIYQINLIRKYTDRPIVVRPHPLGTKTFYKLESYLNKTYSNISVSKNYSSTTTLHGGSGLEEDLKNAYCVITYSSNSAVEAVEKGIPIFTLSPTSTAYDIGHKDFSLIEKLNYDIDISTWCNKLSYTIWNKKEILKGKMWKHLKPVYFKD